MHLVIYTVKEEIFSGQVDSVQLPGSLGKFEILVNHAPLVSTLVKGVVGYTNSVGIYHNLSISAGVVEVLDNKIRVLLHTR